MWLADGAIDAFDSDRYQRAAIAEGDGIVKLSARNQIRGTVVAVTPGAVNGTVKVDIGGGVIITSSITEEAIADLAIAIGDSVVVIVKSSDVLIGK